MAYMYEDYNKCLPKEIWIVYLDYVLCGHWIIKGQYSDLPSTIKFANDLHSIHYHGIHWSEGSIKPEEIKEFLKNLNHRSNRIYVKSRRDANYLEK